MERFIHQQNLGLYRKLLADPNDRDEALRRMVPRLNSDLWETSCFNVRDGNPHALDFPQVQGAHFRRKAARKQHKHGIRDVI